MKKVTYKLWPYYVVGSTIRKDFRNEDEWNYKILIKNEHIRMLNTIIPEDSSFRAMIAGVKFL